MVKNEKTSLLFFILIAIILITTSAFIISLYQPVNYLLYIACFSFAAILFTFSIYNPEGSFILFIFLTPLVESSRTVFNSRDFNFNFFLFLGLFLGGIINFIKNKNTIDFNHRIYKPALVAIAISLISFLTVIFRVKILPYLGYGMRNFQVNIIGFPNDRALFYASNYFLLFLSGLLLVFYITRIKFNKSSLILIFYLLSAGFLITFFIAIYQIKINADFGNFFNYAVAKRMNSTLNDPNSFSNYLSIIFPVFIGFGYCLYGYKKIIGVFSFLLALLALFVIPYTGARIGFLGVILVTLFYLFYVRKLIAYKIFLKHKKNKIIIIILSYLIIFIILFIGIFGSYTLIEKYGISKNLPSGLQRFASNIYYATHNAFKEILYDRTKLWRQAINMFLAHPVTGVGIGQYLFELPNYNYRFYGNPKMVFDNTCNLYLETLAEMGIFQLIMILWFLVEVILAFIFVYRKMQDNKFKFFVMNLFLSFIIMLIIYSATGVTSSFAVRYLFFTIIGVIVNFRIRFEDYRDIFKF